MIDSLSFYFFLSFVYKSIILVIIVVVKHKVCPVILRHIFAVVGINSTRVKLLKTIVIAVKLADVYGKTIVFFKHCVSRTAFFQTFHHSRNNFLDICLLLKVIRFIFKQSRRNFLDCAGASVTVNKIGKNLF